jgi:hypothetical protein
VDTADIKQFCERRRLNEWSAALTQGDDWIVLGKWKTIKVFANNAAPLMSH